MSEKDLSVIYMRTGARPDAENQLKLIQNRMEMLELERRALELQEQMTIDRPTYTGTREIYSEEEDDFDLRVKAAIQDLIEYHSPLHVMCLQYLHFILDITGSSDATNPTLMDIEAFEDFLEPFIVVVMQHDMKGSLPQLSGIMDKASQVVEDLLISDFIYSPYTKKDATARYVMVSPEFNYATENLLNIPTTYRLKTDISVSDELTFKDASMIINEGEPPIIRLTLKSMDGAEDVNELLQYVDIDTFELANIYLKTEMFPSQYEDYRLTDSITRLMLMNIADALKVKGGGE